MPSRSGILTKETSTSSSSSDPAERAARGAAKARARRAAARARAASQERGRMRDLLGGRFYAGTWARLLLHDRVVPTPTTGLAGKGALYADDPTVRPPRPGCGHHLPRRVLRHRAVDEPAKGPLGDGGLLDDRELRAHGPHDAPHAARDGGHQGRPHPGRDREGQERVPRLEEGQEPGGGL